MPPSAPTHPNLTHWLKKVQFKLHETYAQSTRTIEAPGPFEVTETGWGEFEVQMKLFFVPEANEKATTLWHALKLHPFGDRAEEAREKKEPVVSQCYEEIVFTEPVEAFYDILTSNGPLPGQRGSGGSGKGGKGGSANTNGAGAGSKQLSVTGRQKGMAGIGGTITAGRTAEIPDMSAPDNPFSRIEEEKEVSRLREAIREVEVLVKKERQMLEEKEKTLTELRKEAATVTTNSGATAGTK